MTYRGSYNHHHIDPIGRSVRGSLEAMWNVSSAGLVEAAVVRVNRWHGRVAPRWESARLRDLKQGIAATGGNVVPVLCRSTGDGTFIELVYGSLRTQACRELGLPVFIVLRDLMEHELFATMIREGSDGWSLFELGTSIARALDAGLFPSCRRLAADCGLKPQVTRAALEVAMLPDSIVQAFGSQAKLTLSAASKLVQAFNADPGGVERRAQALTPGPSSRVVLAALLKEPE